MSKTAINYQRIADAIKHYSKCGYEYIDAPWFVSKESIDVTRPENTRYFETFIGNLVASGEQSFVEIRNDLCPSRKYQCVTPCFRDDDYDEMRLPYFLKLELIIVLWKNDQSDNLEAQIISDARAFFSKYGKTEIVKTDVGHDLNMFGYELGSYGYREHKEFRWIYGTGVAEPRLSQVIEKRKIEHDQKIAQAQVFEYCCECGEEYPQKELLAGEIYCELCREKGF